MKYKLYILIFCIFLSINLVSASFFGDIFASNKDTGSEAVGSVGSAILSKLVSGSIIVIVALIIGACIVGLAFYLRYNSQFIYDIEIKSLRSSGLITNQNYKIIKDKGAFIRNKKDKSVWFRLKNQRVDLPPPPLECMQIGVKGKNYIKILQKSDEEYYYLLPENIDLQKVIRDGKELIIGEESIKVIDGDVAYWNIQRKKADKKLFDVESLFMKLLPYVVPVLMFMLVIFMTYMITQHWGEFSAAASALERAADRLASISNAGTVTTSP